MGIAEKKPDTLLAIHGPCAREYEAQARTLLGRELPRGWQWVPCSRDTAVAATTEGPPVYYKEFLPRSRFEAIKAMVRGSRCDRARRQADILRAAGLPTPAILCWGKGRKNLFLISRGFGGTGFFHYVKTHFTGPLTPAQIKEKRLLLHRAGALIGAMHSKGIVHGDLRQNNLLVRKEGKDFLLSLIDNESNRRWPFIPCARIIGNLTQFAICSDNLLSRTDLLRLFAAYSAAYPRFAGRGRRRLLRTVYARSRARNLEIKVKGEGRQAWLALDTEKFHGQYLRGSVVDRTFSSGLDAARWFQRDGILLKQDKNIIVKRLTVDGRDIIAKRFTAKNLLYCAQIWLKRERAPRLWEMSHCFQALGIPVAAPLAYVLEGRGPWRTVSYFFSAYLAGARDLVVLGREQGRDFPAWLEAKGIMPRMARLLAVLHDNGLCHGDTKWANVLARADTGEFWLIDLDGAGRIGAGLGRKAAKDLGRFLADVSRYGLPARFQEEFIREYCGRRRLKRSRVLEKIQPHIEKILARHGKKGAQANSL
jgi:tRNA A-37 threonylcarbamoyl transferase component Bud32